MTRFPGHFKLRDWMDDTSPRTARYAPHIIGLIALEHLDLVLSYNPPSVYLRTPGD